MNKEHYNLLCKLRYGFIDCSSKEALDTAIEYLEKELNLYQRNRTDFLFNS